MKCAYCRRRVRVDDQSAWEESGGILTVNEKDMLSAYANERRCVKGSHCAPITSSDTTGAGATEV